MIYTADADHVGTDSFSFIAKDDSLAASTPVTVSVQVAAITEEPDCPTPPAKSIRTNGSKIFSLACNGPAVNGVTYAVADQPDHGTLDVIPARVRWWRRTRQPGLLGP